MILILVLFLIFHCDPISSDNELEVFGKMEISLHIGVMTYKKYSTPYTKCVFPRDIMTALTLVSYLYLENHSVNEEDSNLRDSAMVLIKSTSKNETLHHNSFGRVNKMFVLFVIDYIALSLLTDAYVVHKTGVSPAPYANVEFTREESDMFKHNQCLLINYVLDSTRHDSVIAHYLRNIKNSTVGWWITSKYQKNNLC